MCVVFEKVELHQILDLIGVVIVSCCYNEPEIFRKSTSTSFKCLLCRCLNLMSELSKVPEFRVRTFMCFLFHNIVMSFLQMAEFFCCVGKIRRTLQPC